MLIAFLAIAAACCAIPATSNAALGRVVAIGDSLASGMGLGTALPMVNPACGRTTGSYPELTAAKLAASSFEDVTCNGGHSGVYEFSWTGLPQAPNNNGQTIPAQYDSLTSNTEAVILGTGGNEAYFGEVVKACTGADANVSMFYSSTNPKTYTNSCAAYNNSGPGKLAARVSNSKTLVAQVLTKIHQKSPNAKIFLVGVPRVARPDGVGCMMHGMFLTQADGPMYATWEDGLRAAMVDDVNQFNQNVSGNYVRYVDMQTISGTTHTMCEPNWSDRWMNNWVAPSGIPNWGLELHNTPIGAEMTSRAIVDTFSAAGLDTGSQAVNPTKPVVNISAPANNSLTKNASTTITFSATDNVAVTSCTPQSGSSVPLSEGSNTITVDCQDHAGNHGTAQVGVTRDSTPPAITNVVPANNTNTTSASTVLSYSASDSSGTPNCTPASGSIVNLSTGANTLTINCTDAVGNTSSASTIVNRGSKPVVAISAPESGVSTASASINVAFTVGGGASIPANTSCTVGGVATNSASANPVSLVQDLNTITVVCTNQFGSSTPASVNVFGSPPSEVTITAPAEGANTTASSINVAYKISGSSSFPIGTTCTVGGIASSSTQTNSVPLSLGTNSIVVVCTGAFGSKSASVPVNRGNPPVVAISTPTTGTNTAAGSVNVSYTVDGSAGIPAGTGCTVGGASSSSATSNNLPLSLGENVVTVVCSNQFGEGAPASVTVTRGVPPVVAIATPADSTNTSASAVNVGYTIGGASTIPAGTTCTVGGSPSISASTNNVALSMGANTIAVACTNIFGTSSPTSVSVTRGSVPSVAITTPTNNTNTPNSTVNVAFTVGGAASIPAGTTCTVGGVAAASATTNSVSLTNGANSLVVVCTNSFGASSPVSVTVNRGAVPVVAISSPANDTNTTASSVNLVYTVNGSGSIPAGTSCSVGGSASNNPSTNNVSLAMGGNSIAITCSNAFGDSAPVSVSVNRGTPPAVEVISPQDGTATASTSTNVAFTVDGDASIPVGTTCKIGTTATTSATNNSAALTTGPNTITVTCENPFGSDTSSVTITRGNVPAVAIASPANGLKTVASQTNVSFTVAGAGTIPADTTCKVGGQATTSTTTNVVALAIGSNSISVSCTDSLGTGTATATVVRGTAPVLTVSAPANGLNTTGSDVDVDFSVSGSGPPACSVNGSPATSPKTVSLSEGTNTINIFCSNDFGSDGAAITVNRGPAPTVYINAALHTDTDSSVVNATYVVVTDRGYDTIPAGTTCTVNGAPSASPQQNPIQLAAGENTVTVACANSFGTGSATVYVNYIPPVTQPENPGGPTEPVPTPSPTKLSLKLGAAKLKPVRSGGMLMKSGARGGLPLQVKINAAAKVELRVERLSSGRSKKVKITGDTTVSLLAGTSKLRLAGRFGGKALSAGRYRVSAIVPGTTLHAVSKTFRVVR